MRLQTYNLLLSCFLNVKFSKSECTGTTEESDEGDIPGSNWIYIILDGSSNFSNIKAGEQKTFINLNKNSSNPDFLKIDLKRDENMTATHIILNDQSNNVKYEPLLFKGNDSQLYPIRLSMNYLDTPFNRYNLKPPIKGLNKVANFSTFFDTRLTIYTCTDVSVSNEIDKRGASFIANFWEDVVMHCNFTGKSADDVVWKIEDTKINPSYRYQIEQDLEKEISTLKFRPSIVARKPSDSLTTYNDICKLLQNYSCVVGEDVLTTYQLQAISFYSHVTKLGFSNDSRELLKGYIYLHRFLNSNTPIMITSEEANIISGVTKQYSATDPISYDSSTMEIDSCPIRSHVIQIRQSKDELVWDINPEFRDHFEIDLSKGGVTLPLRVFVTVQGVQNDCLNYDAFYVNSSGICEPCFSIKTFNPLSAVRCENGSNSCASGTYGWGSVCTPCPMGYHTKPNSRFIYNCEENLFAKDCNTGQFAQKTGICVACPLGHTSFKGTAGKIQDCFSPPNIHCTEGHFGYEGSCKPCPEGYGIAAETAVKESDCKILCSGVESDHVDCYDGATVVDGTKVPVKTIIIAAATAGSMMLLGLCALCSFRLFRSRTSRKKADRKKISIVVERPTEPMEAENSVEHMEAEKPGGNFALKKTFEIVDYYKSESDEQLEAQTQLSEKKSGDHSVRKSKLSTRTISDDNDAVAHNKSIVELYGLEGEEAEHVLFELNIDDPDDQSELTNNQSPLTSPTTLTSPPSIIPYSVISAKAAISINEASLSNAKTNTPSDEASQIPSLSSAENLTVDYTSGTGDQELSKRRDLGIVVVPATASIESCGVGDSDQFLPVREYLEA